MLSLSRQYPDNCREYVLLCNLRIHGDNSRHIFRRNCTNRPEAGIGKGNLYHLG